ncbi:maltase 2-like [Leptopilina heterotoma]|uniref:maltase 2-like n=1 Tax=Leptopilina heterotoma TaxID=63436 RepID=UPI001CA918DB|nr:maltase 2-like [Leptopilina heterotoma]
MFKLTFLFIISFTLGVRSISNDWWRDAVIYQVYPRSLKDSNGDGIGDLNGITSKLEHIKDIGADALWLSPIYSSPQVDFGYDISNFTDIDPQYGTLADFAKLIKRAKELKLKVLLDFVPNHSSDQHPWFKNSIQKIKPYDDYFIWRDAKMVNGIRQPPNNWLSIFKGSAWEWNEQRGQYYYHQFAVAQPDLNYRNSALKQAMSDVLTFWMDRGVEGFRVDAILHLFEDEQLRDEPKNDASNVPADEYASLTHIYTRDLDETYVIARAWRKLLDDYATKHQTDAKFMIVEALTTPTIMKKYYDSGCNPFNFMFVGDFNLTSKAVDFKRGIDRWLDNVPEGNVSNWVTDNHDNHRTGTRFGEKKSDMITMLSLTLPGITVIYYGDEIGMVDKNITYEETVDVAGCNLGPDRYYLASRDPERTPFQWDTTTSAGFSTNSKTWLPVHENYKTLNLAAQKLAAISHYKVFKAMAKIKKNLSVLKGGEVEVRLITENILGVVRRLETSSPVALLINMGTGDESVDAHTWLNIPEELIIYTASVGSQIQPNTKVNTSALRLPGSSSLFLATKSQIDSLDTKTKPSFATVSSFANAPLILIILVIVNYIVT